MEPTRRSFFQVAAAAGAGLFSWLSGGARAARVEPVRAAKKPVCGECGRELDMVGGRRCIGLDGFFGRCSSHGIVYSLKKVSWVENSWTYHRLERDKELCLWTTGPEVNRHTLTFQVVKKNFPWALVTKLAGAINSVSFLGAEPGHILSIGANVIKALARFSEPERVRFAASLESQNRGAPGAEPIIFPRAEVVYDVEFKFEELTNHRWDEFDGGTGTFRRVEGARAIADLGELIRAAVAAA
jgi:hypothetical protein